MAERCFLIVNPTSGSYSQQKIERVMTALRGHGLIPELMLTGSAADAPLFARRICAEEAEPFIVAGGGDGTINGVVNGLVPGRATLGVLPFGTANVLARELNIKSVDDAVQKLVRGGTRRLQIGLIEARGERKYFFLMAGIGFDGAVVENVRLGEKKIIGKGAYLLSALRTLAAWDRQKLEIKVDGRVVECHGAVVCNGAKYGGDFVLAPAADIFTPGFQVLCVRGGKRWTYLKLALDMVAGRPPQGKDIAVFPARELEISGNKAIQVDGDYYCHAPVRITAVEDFVRVIV
ncbi:diacylglycerol/lipid kinase family protein [Geotalea uraniireducens]|uniref:Diacylglycerol kinase, catalytic region n=1 Tax=Geotalea uraniireducens (strain Rf4) TaxID=351605 RepID=A5GEG6_GEOUR|nr:YegS/Rv2252/BmrU family lipid kinase [Geotalea uraniireducens]ABQ25821.1 diacylglycerol kinase, catalytic region [Geotalea uraniireducens Rf4]